MLDKGIFNGKEHRKQYRKSQAFDRSCRNHGSCTRCREGRLFHDKKLHLENYGEFDEEIQFAVRTSLEVMADWKIWVEQNT